MKNITLVVLVAILFLVYNIPTKKYDRFIPQIKEVETIIQTEYVVIEVPQKDFEFADFYQEQASIDGKENEYFFILIGASWCQPCKKLKEAIIGMKPSVKIAYLDYDELINDKVWHPYLFRNRPLQIPQLLRLRATKIKGTWEKLYWDSSVSLQGFLK
jgi:thiol-disulfide isomerase/thioredoxin